MTRQRPYAPICLALLLAAAAAPGARADYPTQPVRWIVPYPPGGGTDAVARTLSEAMQRDFGQSFVIDNRPGAATNIAVAALLQSKPDGHTIMQAENAALLFNEHMFGKLPYKPDADFTYIGAIGRFPVALVVTPSFPARTLAEFIAHVKARPGKVDYASPGNGTPHHVAMELLKEQAGLRMVHVPYKGGAPAMQDVMGGQVPAMMMDLAGGLPTMRSGGLRPLAIALPQRAKALPDVPTFAELGLKDVNAYAFHGLIGPAGMPQEAVAKINAALNKAMEDPKVVKLFSDFGMEALPGTPADFRATARSESARWGKVIKAVGIHLD